MNTKIVGIIAGFIVLGAGGVWLASSMSTPESAAVPIRTTEQTIENVRPAVQARPNSFGIMTPEEAAAAQAAAAAAAAASTSTATTTSTSSDETLPETAAEDNQSETPN